MSIRFIRMFSIATLFVFLCSCAGQPNSSHPSDSLLSSESRQSSSSESDSEPPSFSETSLGSSSSEEPSFSSDSSQSSSDPAIAKFVIDFDLNGGSSPSYSGPKEVESFDEINFFFDCEKEGWNFRGWSYEGRVVCDENDVKAFVPEMKQDMVFVAEYSQTAKLTISINIPEAGETSGAGEYSYNSNVDVIAYPKLGYRFLGWFYRDSLLANSPEYKFTMWDKDIVLEARFGLDAFRLKLKSNNASHGLVSVVDNDSNYQDSIELYKNYTSQIRISAYSKTNVRFLGWYDESNALVSSNAIYEFSMPNRTYCLEAKWNYFTINYDLNGGINNPDNPDHYTTDDSFICLLNPSKDHYEFVGWRYLDQFIEGVSSSWLNNITLCATWKAKNYSITYNLNGGTNSDENPSSYTIDSESISLKQATKNGYEFGGWFADSEFESEKNEISAGSFGDIVLFAKWIPIDYSITYILNGGTNDPNNPSSYTIEDSFRLLDPSRGAYQFLGWYDETDAKISNIAIGTCGDRVLTAKWQLPNEFSEFSDFEFDVTGGKITITGVVDNSIADIVVPDSVSFIAKGAFAGCDSLASIQIPFIGGGSSDNNFFGFVFGASSPYEQSRYIPSSLKTVILSNACTSIESHAFYQCSSISSISFGPAMVTIRNAFDYCYLNDVNIFIESVSQYLSISGLSYLNGVKHFYDENGTKITDIVVPDSVTSIDANAFQNADIRSAVIENGLSSLPSSMFKGSSIEEAVLPNGLEKLSSSLFIDCKSLKRVQLPDGLTYIPSGTFSGCSSLQAIELPQTITSIETGAFSDCSSLKKIEIPELVERIWPSAFKNCTSLTDIKLPSKGYSIAEESFYNCSSLLTLNVNAGYIGQRAFQNCVRLATISFGDEVRNIGDYAFLDCRSLHTLEIPSGVKSIGAGAFSNCYLLEEAEISSSVTALGRWPFNNCVSLNSVTFVVGSIKEFLNITGKIGLDTNVHIRNLNKDELTEVLIPDDVTSIPEWSFHCCSSITSITLPAGISTIGIAAFQKCRLLKNLIFKGTVEEWNHIILGSGWREKTLLTSVCCSDGDVSL